MKIFLAWSGNSSKSVALLLHKWLQDVIQALQPFMSEESIRSGQRWFTEIGSHLAETNFAILCMTPMNLKSPWIHFEAGAVSKNLEKSRVCPLLLDLKPTALGLPLSQFQNSVVTSKEGMRKLLNDINAALGDQKRTDTQLTDTFEKYWADFEAGIAEALHVLATERTGPAKPKRSTEDILAEMLAAQQGTLNRLDALESQITQIGARQVVWTNDIPPLSAPGDLAVNRAADSSFKTYLYRRRMSILRDMAGASSEGSMPTTLQDPPPPKKEGPESK